MYYNFKECVGLKQDGLKWKKKKKKHLQQRNNFRYFFSIELENEEKLGLSRASN